MFKPLLDAFGAQPILSASMATIHAATGSQQVLDRLPKSGKLDLRKNRSIINNIILTTTGAAKALSLVIPEMSSIGFIAESVRIPTSTGSLIILVLSLQEKVSGRTITREAVNRIYADAAANDPHRYLQFTEEQNVSGDIVGAPQAAAIIEGHETHTRTAELTLNLENVPGIPKTVLNAMESTIIRPQVTQAVIYGWYDNEMGSYVNMLGDRIESVADYM
jgi:glyceraldehyde 3-phosphate dehydrogenase